MAAEAQFEDPAQLHAVFHGNSAAHQGPPQEWVDALKIHSTQVRRIAICWRRGSAPYTPIPGAVLELPEVLKKTGDQEVPDERTTDAKRWAEENARQRWAVAVEWAKKNGPVIDCQLQLWGFDKKKGVFKILKGGAIAKRVNLTGEGAAWMDDGATTERVLMTYIDKLIEHNCKLLDRATAKDDAIAKHYANIGNVVSGTLGVFQTAMQMREQHGASNLAFWQAKQNYMIELAKIRATEQGVTNAVNQIAPTLKDIFSGWTMPREAPPHREIAEKILRSVTDSQREQWKAAGFGDLIADVESALRQVQSSESVEAAAATLKKIAPTLVANQDSIGNLLTPQQREWILLLLGLPGVVDG